MSRGHPDAVRWNARYRRAYGSRRFQVDERLLSVEELLQAPGTALELACGTGASAMWLASKGWRTVGVDVSIEALRIARSEARRRALSIHWVLADVTRTPLREDGHFDLVVVMRFLDRRLFPWIRAALIPGGQVFYATFNRGRLDRQPDFNPRFVLEPGELAGAFAGFELQAGRDEEQISWLLARKPDAS